MTTLHARPAALTAAAALALTLTACGSDNVATPGAATDIEVTTPTAVPEEEFSVNDVADITTDEIGGERVDDPGMDLAYTWQGTSSASGSGVGTVVVVAVTNKSDAPMPADALGQPKLTYTSGGNNRETASPMSGEDAGVSKVGLDMPLGPGATVNLKYPYNVSMTNLWDAQFTIGNVTFRGNLNN